MLNGVPASQLLPNGSIYSVERNQSVEVTIPGGAGGSDTGGPVSLQSTPFGLGLLIAVLLHFFH
jgi:hypothetical protein